ncbi:MAG: sugar ABC transporter ATP-binding protein [Propionibacteriaceae bacterium]|jgi:ribose transport system ATP-binding protein|nr:sugar ABC transporter ATP-binding protein [Propionibacteriaceae bacterium]
MSNVDDVEGFTIDASGATAPSLAHDATATGGAESVAAAPAGPVSSANGSASPVGLDTMVPRVHMRGIDKSFGGVPVLKQVELRLGSGEVVGLLGSNGAGKSTLIKILSGVYSADAGTIEVDGVEEQVTSATRAQRLGIRTVHQELSLVGHLRVYENIFLHDEETRGKRTILSPLNRATMIEQARDLLNVTLNVAIDPLAEVSDLTTAEQQLVEIAKAVHKRARVLILDEPTTSLEAREKTQLFNVVRDLKATGAAIVFISHHLDEITELCDRTVVLRDGVVALDEPTAGLTARDMVAAMTGATGEHQYPKTIVPIGGPVLTVNGLTHKTAFSDVSFTLHRSEILGVVGLAGCGKSELIRSLYGAVPVTAGTITLRGAPVRIGSIPRAKKLGLSYLPADRKREGIFPEHTVRWNMTIAALKRVLGRFGLSPAKETATVDAAIVDYGVKVRSPFQLISRLSGGNQQKVMLARCLMNDADVVLLEDPTRGIDVQAKNDMYSLITGLVEAGKSVLLVSSEETEVLGMCDRVLVLRDGRVRADVTPETTTLETLRLIVMSSEGDLR